MSTRTAFSFFFAGRERTSMGRMINFQQQQKRGKRFVQNETPRTARLFVFRRNGEWQYGTHDEFMTTTKKGKSENVGTHRFWKEKREGKNGMHDLITTKDKKTNGSYETKMPPRATLFFCRKVECDEGMHDEFTITTKPRQKTLCFSFSFHNEYRANPHRGKLRTKGEGNDQKK